MRQLRAGFRGCAVAGDFAEADEEEEEEGEGGGGGAGEWDDKVGLRQKRRLRRRQGPETESTSFEIVNNCNYTVWPAVVSSGTVNLSSLSTTGFTLKSGASFILSVPKSWTALPGAKPLRSLFETLILSARRLEFLRALRDSPPFPQKHPYSCSAHPAVSIDRLCCKFLVREVASGIPLA
ncbi:hypothetical protein ACLB2K_074780 [Fragaria x ananassa]